MPRGITIAARPQQQIRIFWRKLRCFALFRGWHRSCSCCPHDRLQQSFAETRPRAPRDRCYRVVRHDADACVIRRCAANAQVSANGQHASTSRCFATVESAPEQAEVEGSRRSSSESAKSAHQSASRGKVESAVASSPVTARLRKGSDEEGQARGVSTRPTRKTNQETAMIPPLFTRKRQPKPPRGTAPLRPRPTASARDHTGAQGERASKTEAREQSSNTTARTTTPEHEITESIAASAPVETSASAAAPTRATRGHGPRR